MAGAAKDLGARNAQKTASVRKLGRALGVLVEKKFAQMSATDRVSKHREFMSALKGRRS